MSSLLLFDVDGTLLLTGGAGRRSLERAFRQVFGIERAFEGVRLAGRTDPSLLDDALAKSGVPRRDGDGDRFRTAYLEALADELDRKSSADSGNWSDWHSFKGVFPGVREVLGALGTRNDVFVALMTGNYEAGARLKLSHFGLLDHFGCGAFGEDAPERWQLVEVARARADAAGSGPVALADTWVIGDTPLDVAAARQAGVRSLAVATGGYGTERLTESGADVVLSRLAVEALPF
jgi:phosphoglycolate phosphatase